MHRRPLTLFLVSVLIFIISTFLGCKNDPAKIGIDIQPETERFSVKGTDTTTIFAHSVFLDSVRSDKTSRTMLGSYNDPVFGTSTVALNLQFRLSTASLELGESPVLDSMILSLQYASMNLSGLDEIFAYGDTTTTQTFRVYEITDNSFIDTIYYSNQILTTNNAESAIHVFEPKPTDSIVIEDEKVKARLRIKMEDSFVQKFRDASVDDLSSIENFLSFLPGLKIQPDDVSDGGAILFFDATSTFTRLTLYYSNQSEDSLIYHFPVTSTSARFMNFSHDYSLASAEFQQQLNGDTTLGQQKFFLQSLAGVAAVIELPYIKEYSKNKNLALNLAKLIITNSDTENEFAPPVDLVLFNISPDGSNTFLADQFEGVDYFGGSYESSNGEYFFRITQQMQNILQSDTIPPRFYLSISGASIMPNRVVCNGFNQPSSRLRLELIFTELN
jgi:hypothetical protein